MNEPLGRIVLSRIDSSWDREECGFRMNSGSTQSLEGRIVQPNLGFRHVLSLAFPFLNNVTNLWPRAASLKSPTSCATRWSRRRQVKLISNRGYSGSYSRAEGWSILQRWFSQTVSNTYLKSRVRRSSREIFDIFGKHDRVFLCTFRRENNRFLRSISDFVEDIRII